MSRQEKDRKRYEMNKESRRISQREYYANNKAKAQAAVKAWRERKTREAIMGLPYAHKEKRNGTE